MTEYAVGRMDADARVTRFYGGANEIMKEIVGKGCRDRRPDAEALVRTFSFVGSGFVRRADH